MLRAVLFDMDEEFQPTFGQGTEADVRVFGLRCTPAELDRFYMEHFPRYAEHACASWGWASTGMRGSSGWASCSRTSCPLATLDQSAQERRQGGLPTGRYH